MYHLQYEKIILHAMSESKPFFYGKHFIQFDPEIENRGGILLLILILP